MKGITFYAELPEERGSKKASKRFKAFTRESIKYWASAGFHLNCIAVLDGNGHIGQGGQYLEECLSATFDHENSDVSVGGVARDFLRKRCVRIDEATARALHPRLAARLDME